MFNREKDLVLKVVNLILILWLMGSIIYLYSTVVNVIIKEPKLTYEEFELNSCNKYDEDTNCLEMYEKDKIYYKDNDKQDLKNILIASGNIILVSSTIYILNRERKN